MFVTAVVPAPGVPPPAPPPKLDAVVGVDTSLWLFERETPEEGPVKANGDGQACSKGECRSPEDPKFDVAFGAWRCCRAGFRKFFDVEELFVGVRLK